MPEPQRPRPLLSRFHFLRPIGAGAHGEVWEARMAGAYGVSKQVAVKVVRLDPGAGGTGAAAALIGEARACARVRHGNVVDVYEVGEEGGVFYAAMELIRGITFSQILARVRDRGTRLPPSAVVDLLAGACRGLEAAHRAEGEDGRPLHLVHRDVKPGNLMLAAGGIVKVLDFGIALATTNLSETGTGIVKGTPWYMAPEQWAGDRTGIGPWTDVFSLALVGAELATGERVLGGDSVPAVYRAMIGSTPSQDVAGVAEVCPALAPLLARCLARDPGDRPASAGVVAGELRAIRARLPASGDLDWVARLVGADEGGDGGMGEVPIPADPAWAAFVQAMAGPGEGPAVEAGRGVSPIVASSSPEMSAEKLGPAAPATLPWDGGERDEQPALAVPATMRQDEREMDGREGERRGEARPFPRWGYAVVGVLLAAGAASYGVGQSGRAGMAVPEGGLRGPDSERVGGTVASPRGEDAGGAVAPPDVPDGAAPAGDAPGETGGSVLIGDATPANASPTGPVRSTPVAAASPEPKSGSPGAAGGSAPRRGPAPSDAATRVARPDGDGRTTPPALDAAAPPRRIVARAQNPATLGGVVRLEVSGDVDGCTLEVEYWPKGSLGLRRSAKEKGEGGRSRMFLMGIPNDPRYTRGVAFWVTCEGGETRGDVTTRGEVGYVEE